MSFLSKYIVKTLQNSKLLWVCVLPAAFASCKKESYSKVNQVSAAMSGISTSYVENGNAILLNGKVYHFTPDYVGIPMNAGSSSADTIFAEVDPSLVSAYNQLYSETNPSVPEGAFGASGNGVFPVKAGTATSGDSLYAVLNNASQLQDSTVYLVPIRLKNKKGPEPKPSIVFFKMRVHNITLGAMFDTLARVSDVGLNSYQNGFLASYYLNSDANGVMISPDELSIPIKLNAAFPEKDLKVSAKIYNDEASIKDAGPYYTPFPDDTYSLEKSDFTIPSGSVYAQDSLKLQIKNKAKFQPYTSYLLVLQLEEYTGAGQPVPAIKSKASRVYISFFVF